MRRCACVLIATCLVTVLTLPAGAQDALGSGDALDANLGVNTGRRNTAVQSLDMRRRNLLVTGSVAGGRGFRGTVGYAAESDFRGELGSDQLYDFRAGSAFSDINFINYGTTYQQLRFGQELGLVEYQRAGRAASLETIEAPQFRQTASSELWLRSTIDRVSRLSETRIGADLMIEPRIIGAAPTEEGGPMLIGASPLRGVFVQSQGEYGQAIGLSSYDLLRVREDQAAGRVRDSIGRPFESDFTDLLLTPARGEAAVEEARVVSSGEPDYERIMERIAQRYAEADEYDVRIEQGLLQELDVNMEDLRRRLRGEQPEQQQPGVLPPETQPPPEPEAAPAEEAGPFDRSEGAEQAEDGRRILTAEELALILRHGGRVEQLSGETKDRFNELLASGEEYLREGKYFWAERRFERAMQFVPGHPLGSVGIIHAQLGAGLYLSASLSLRRLFTQHPEMIDARYGEGLIPPDKRLREAVSELRQRLPFEPANRSTNALLLAYVGRLLDAQSIIEQGLDAMDEADPDDPLAPLLREIWLAPPEPAAGDAGGKSEPPPAPPEPEK